MGGGRGRFDTQWVSILDLVGKCDVEKSFTHIYPASAVCSKCTVVVCHFHYETLASHF